ncbi:MAG: YgiQ family radical SAM protein [Alistipes sp.]|jgi:radical SAM superfamily enzyme YgiQ (UPF0313 family)|nr:YgiQ family radical SAM protein [Alistipes sp.]
MGFLPTTIKEVRALGWDAPDVILFTGDAYIDHPSFGAAVIGRLLEAEGLRVAVVPQPGWRDDLRDFRKLGAPKLFFGVTAGSMDSMVNHYTANKRLRSDDAYTAGGVAGRRPDRAATVYSRILKELYPRVPVVLGGIEASLRRLAHYDYWDDALRPSILADSGADVVAYGMGDESMIEIARALKNGPNIKLLRRLPQVAFLADEAYVGRLDPESTLRLHSMEECTADPKKFAENFVRIETESNLLHPARTIVEPVGDKFVVVNAPYPLMSTATLDRSFELPYERLPHPRYNTAHTDSGSSKNSGGTRGSVGAQGGGEIPAWEMITNSVNIHRGCFGGCSFCTISAHQGKFITSRSEASVLREVERLVRMPYFRGNLSDLGGPSANMYGMAGRDGEKCDRCRRPSCLTPGPCANLDRSHARLLELYRRVRAVKGVKKAFVGSGIRYDLFEDGTRGGEYLREVIVNHTSGRLKVAPEHTEEHVLRLMRKPPWESFERLNADFRRMCEQEGLRTQLIPYFISSHPGCSEGDMKRLSEKTRRLHLHTDQVQDLTPTPMTLASVMFYTGEDPYTGERLFVARSQDDKRRQKSYFFKK